MAEWQADIHYPLKPKVLMPAEVKAAGTRILLTERAALMFSHLPPRPWTMEETQLLPVSIRAWAPHEAESAGLDRLTYPFEKRFASRAKGARS